MKISGARIVTMVLVVLTILSLFVICLMRYQLVDGASFRQAAQKTSLSVANITAPRGEILDRYGRSLATNRIGYDIVFEWAFFPKSSTESAKENSMILNLTRILSSDNEQWSDSFPITQKPYAFTTDTTSVTRLRKLLNIGNDVTADQVMELLVKRYKINGSYSDTDKRTIAGIRYEMEQRAFSINNNTFKFATDVSINTVTKISERNSDFPGVETSKDPIRIYSNGTIAPHIIGTLGPIFADQYSTLKQKGYQMNDTIGKSGIEESMEEYLRGIDGQKSIELNSSGKVVGEIVTKQTKPGDNVVLTIDSQLQAVLQNSLASTIQSIVQQSGGSVEHGSQAKSGAAVVLDVKTGEVLAMASYPSFDLNTYAKEYSSLINQSTSPLLNRAISGTYRPGSTFKPVVAVAGLMSNAITANTTFFCTGSLTRYNHTFLCDAAHGSENVIGAIRDSCNNFFYNTGDLTGIKNIDNTATALGLGQLTNIELPGEKSGVLAGPQERASSGQSWYPGDVLQASIGQSDNMFTPLQLANYISTFLNGGSRHDVHIIKQINTYDNSSVVYKPDNKVVSKLNIPSSVIETVKVGMGQVTENGTAADAFQGYVMKVGGKTGTAEVPGGYNGVFVAFAPYDNPQIAVAAVVEHGYHGNEIAPLARDVFNYYFYNANNVQSQQKESAILP